MPEATPDQGRLSLLIHIGYHKTGSTWMQTGIFQDESAGFTKPWSSKQIRDQFVFPTSFEFDAIRARESFQPAISAASERSLLPVLSDERLSGSPHAGGYDSATIADRLAVTFPDARVLIVIREQKSAIHSIYQQYVRDGGAAPLKSYLAPRNPAEIPQFRFSHLEYHHLIQHYFKRFCAKNVLVLPYEWLQKDSGIFLGRISEFLGLNDAAVSTAGSRYPSLSAMTISLKRWANLFFVRNSLNPAARFYVKDHERRFEVLDRFIPAGLSKLVEEKQRNFIAAAVNSRYVMSNNETEKLIEVDLKALGYSVGEE